MRILKIPIKKEFYDMILSGKKPEEYREIKDYWTGRLKGAEKKGDRYDVIEFVNGYDPNSPSFIIQYLGWSIGYPNPEWCPAEFLGKKYYILKLGKILEVREKEPLRSRRVPGSIMDQKIKKATDKLTDDSIFEYGRQYKGKKMSEVPDEYLVWVYNKAKGVPRNIIEYIVDNMAVIKGL